MDREAYGEAWLFPGKRTCLTSLPPPLDLFLYLAEINLISFSTLLGISSPLPAPSSLLCHVKVLSPIGPTGGLVICRD